MSTQSWRGRASPAQLARRLAAVAVGAMLAAVAGCGSAATAPPQGGARFTDAVAQTSLAYVQVNWRGWLVLPREVSLSSTEYLPQGTYGPFTAVSSCSGFVASTSGDVVTAGHCVDAASVYGGKGAILAAWAAQATHPDGRPLTPAEQTSYADALAANASVEGSASGSPVNRAVKVTVPSLSGGSHPANVVDVQPFTQGDEALLKVTGLAATALPVAASAPQNGDSVVAAGYPGDVAAVVDSATPPSFLAGSVSGTQTVNGTPFTQISSQVSAGMSGGPVLNMAGQVVGTVSWAPSGATGTNFMTDIGSIHSLLAGNGVSTSQTPAGRAFRQGLAYYFADRYHEAVTQFDQSLALQPGQPVAAHYRQQAVANYPKDVSPPSSGLPAWAYAAIGAAVLALAGGAGVILMRRRRARPPGEPTAQAPPPAPATPQPPAQPEPRETAQQVPGQAKAGAIPSAPGVPEARPQPREQRARHFCTHCGLEHTEEAHYCEKCGQPFATDVSAKRGGD
jgi:serine protease Do